VCAATSPSQGAGCPHQHVPHRSRWRPSGRHLRGAVRGLGLLAIPAGLLASRGPIDRPPVRAEAILESRDADNASTVKHWLESTLERASVVKINELERWSGSRRRPARSPSPGHAVRAIAEALSKCQATLSDNQRWRIAGAIESEARRHGYDPLFVQALVEVESTCQPTARSARGALGLTQVQPATARALARDAGMPWQGAHTLLDPELNLRLGLLYLTQLYDRFGDMDLAMAAYNVGPERAAGMSRDRARRSHYVRKILARYEDLRASHNALG